MTRPAHRMGRDGRGPHQGRAAGPQALPIDAEIARAERSLERYFESFEQGRLSPARCEQRVAALQSRLDDLGAQQAELAENDSEGSRAPTADDLAAVAGRLETLIADGQPEQTKALLRLLIAELRVNSKADSSRPTVS